MTRNFHLPGRSAVYAQNGLCATSHPLAAQVAVEILKSGGNAMDAAIAGAVVLGICEPQMTGIGGDCFALFKPTGSEDIHAYNGSGWAPRAADASSLRAQGMNVIGDNSVDSVTIPGAIDAFCNLSSDWGKLGLDQILAPAIHYAEDGVPIAPRVAADCVGSAKQMNASSRRFYTNNGRDLKLGDVFRSPRQAEVLRRVATQGRDGFYTGEVVEDMVTSLNALGGCHAAEDFADLKTFATQPVSGRYPLFDLYEHPPNGQGATAILLMNILEQMGLERYAADSAERLHIEAEATKLAFDARNRFIADPETSATERMLSLDVAQQLAGLIDPKRALTQPTSLTESVHKDTVYITVVDKDRMAVSLIYSIFHNFGSGLASDKFGILFQNRGCGFNLIDGHPNEYGSRKRPMHTIIPGMAKEKGRVTLPFGVMGGQFQPLGHARLLHNHFLYGMDWQSAVDFPRAFAEQGVLKLEAGISDRTAQQLADLRHQIVRRDVPLGGAQAIYMHESGVLEGVSDPRKDGLALGY
jgi:gamma-glutamyltranspeptidase/glutathione hydrolase